MDPGAILTANGMSVTRTRVNILETMKRSAVPLSGKEICQRLNEGCDKSTVYRTLNTLFNKEVLQRVIIDHEVKYALRTGDRSGNGHERDHLHFKCSACERLFCLTEIEVADYQLPEGFRKEENQFLVIGKCNKCQ
jgi:Fur family ferric uptake transcriptional regulator